MSIINLPERLLQRAAHVALTDVTCLWECTNADVIQVVAAGLPNVHAGPDYQDMAVLHNGIVYVGDGEFHRRTSDWNAHEHSESERYADLMLHIVLDDDVPDTTLARWTVVIPKDRISEALTYWRNKKRQANVDIEEVQHYALLRLLRHTADAQALTLRLGLTEGLRAMASSWFSRMAAKSRRPVDTQAYLHVRNNLASSALGKLVINFPSIPSADIPTCLEQASQQRIATEGAAIRRELLVNVILPFLFTQATHDQRVVLLQWYWGARSAHEYGILGRKFSSQPQDHVWEQQGMLEFLRHHGRRISTCGEAIRAYGVAGTLEFLRASG
ncbi:MAG: DUF2851 family protein [Bradyrhizobiaceae bacterium]|nr:DUF2851 family protein [Bradyrhizobiaceae bacterium]